MREMVLNHASLCPPDCATAVNWLKDLITGMATLVTNDVASPTLRASLFPSEIRLLQTWTLNDAHQVLGRERDGRDAFLFFLRLETKAPLLCKAESDLKGRFLMCEDLTLASPDGATLVFCAVSNGISVGFPSAPNWDKSRVAVIFREMLPNGTIIKASEEIDNLTRSSHAAQIVERSRADRYSELTKVSDGRALWAAVGRALPNLAFGPDVEDHLTAVNTGDLGTIINKLANLDQAAADWRKTESRLPLWRTKVTDESASVKNNPVLRQARQFRSKDGSRKLFFFHARYGSSGRIHLRIIRSKRVIEVGYIGPHLPL